MILEKTYKFINLSGCEKKLLMNCVFTLIKTSILIEFFSQKYITPCLGNPVKENAETNLSEQGWEITKKVVKNIRRALKIIPWKIKCYPHALAGKIILKKYNINSYLYLGLNKENHKLSAHAWLSAGGKIIIGERSAGKFTQIGIFY